ncbi:possible respiratory chain protein [Pyrobaculum aerophilum str. IM2]|uniref:Possible respiratory chain protein n=2 Tax=Pyrobaculum aerophilum TaxID=13773 RepID=Q8ZXD3_PYRAE|nr:MULTISPECIES: hypothetical protein [Pyrobaculum]AAL63415.1 possible respiratory chain protein [Pyrobaculum aerophilum str. IM2]HII45986.1 respiratory chain protein [Pyrobaculum aerophilum]
MSGGLERRDPSLIKVFGFIGALSFILEGLLLPVSIAAHILLLLAFRWASSYFGKISIFRKAFVWFITAVAGSIAIAATLKLTLLSLYLGGRMELWVGILWAASALPFWLLVAEMSRISKIGLFTYSGYTYAAGATAMALGAFLMPLYEALGTALIKISIFPIVYSFLLLGLALWKID